MAVNRPENIGVPDKKDADSFADKMNSQDPRLASGNQLLSKYLYGGRDISTYESMHNAKVEIITTDTVDGQNLAWRVVRRLNADKPEQQTYSEYNLPLLHVGFSNTDKRDFFGYFKSSQVVDGPSGPDPWDAYQRHSDVILDKGMNADAFLIQHGYNQDILNQARENIEPIWTKKFKNDNVKEYAEFTRNCWHYMHAVETEYVKLGGVLYLKHVKK